MEQAAVHAAAEWHLEPAGIRNDLFIGGSPQRSEFRCVVECADGKLAVMECIRRSDRAHKQAVIDRLDFLAHMGLPGAHPHLTTVDGRHIAERDGRPWQASPYITGVTLERPGYEFDGWRGQAMGEFLVALRTASRELPGPLSTRPFAILDYIGDLLGRIRTHDPAVLEPFIPAAAFLEERLAPVHGLLPVGFCHGDFHPVNVIWSEDAIAGVIDWEFCGVKPEGYDAALLVGCMGMETPDALTGPLVGEFIRSLREARLLSDTSWRYLIEMIVAIRFGWLSEWLRARDEEMIELEAVYMRLLMDHADEISALWGAHRGA
jgi:homoserine kinase type II